MLIFTFLQTTGMMVSGVSRRVCRDHHELPTGVYPNYRYCLQVTVISWRQRGALEALWHCRDEDGRVLQLRWLIVIVIH